MALEDIVCLSPGTACLPWYQHLNADCWSDSVPEFHHLTQLLYSSGTVCGHVGVCSCGSNWSLITTVCMFLLPLLRFREILAHNYVVPWELVCIFKQVLRDFLRRQEEVGYRRTFPPAPPILLPACPPPADIDTCDQKNTAMSSLERQEKCREEIPTISSYVDKHLHSACSYTVHRDCLPYCRSFPYD